MTRLQNFITTSFILCLGVISLCQGASKNVTKEIFGHELNFLPVAFGDFNSDKLTDLFVITADRKTIFVLLAEGEELFSKPFSSHIYFKMPSKIGKRRLQCTLNNKIIESVIPGDFDGDGGMDVFVLTSKIDTEDEPVSKLYFLPTVLNSDIIIIVLGFFLVSRVCSVGRS